MSIPSVQLRLSGEAPKKEKEVMENVIGAHEARPSHIGRSIAAVAAGLVTIVVTHSAADAALHAAGVFPPLGEPMGNGLFALAAAYRFVLSVGGAYVAARLAPARPRKHALVLGVIGVVLSTLGVVARLVKGPELGPLWYPVVLVLMTLPCCFLGSALHRDVKGEKP